MSKPSATSLRETAPAISSWKPRHPTAGSWFANRRLPPREDRIDVTFAGDGAGTLLMKHHGTGQVFVTPDALSEFLLVPVLTGRPR